MTDYPWRKEDEAHITPDMLTEKPYLSKTPYLYCKEAWDRHSEYQTQQALKKWRQNRPAPQSSLGTYCAEDDPIMLETEGEYCLDDGPFIYDEDGFIVERVNDPLLVWARNNPEIANRK